MKSRILRMLKEDEEFRYAVAGLIGFTDILKRLEEHDRKFNEIIARLDEHDRKFNEIIARLDEHDRKFNEVIARLEEHDRKFNEIITRLDEHDRKFNEIMEEVRNLRREMSRVTAYIERTSLTIEEEAREIISYRLRSRGVELKLSSLVLPDLEINVYGVNENLCIVGEVSTRAGVGIIEKLDEDITKLSRKHPECLREKTVKVVYTMQATPDAVQEARERGIWLLKATEDLTQPPV
jgi:chromosome segregation ATPase